MVVAGTALGLLGVADRAILFSTMPGFAGTAPRDRRRNPVVHFRRTDRVLDSARRGTKVDPLVALRME